jgi:hypothetical protein
MLEEDYLPVDFLMPHLKGPITGIKPEQPGTLDVRSPKDKFL